jgi:transcription antitermination factor NusG
MGSTIVRGTALAELGEWESAIWDFNGGSLTRFGSATPMELPSAGGLEIAGTPSPWFALQVQAKRELGVAAFLRGKGYDPFVPLYHCRKVWSDRIKVVDAPLFPGYMFCRLNLHHRLPVLTVPGVIRIIGRNRTPVPVDDAEIDTIRTVVTSGLPSEPWPFLRTGDRVQIERGPLRGLEGILVESRGAHRLILSVTLVQRSVAVEIDSAFVTSLGPPLLSSRCV